MISTKNEMFPVFARLYKKPTLFFLMAISTPIGLAGAILQFYYGQIFMALFSLFATIGWSFAVCLPLILQITKTENLERQGKPIKTAALNNEIALIERLFSVLVFILGLAMLLNTVLNDKLVYFIFDSVWIIIFAYAHFSLILITRQYAINKRR